MTPRRSYRHRSGFEYVAEGDRLLQVNFPVAVLRDFDAAILRDLERELSKFRVSFRGCTEFQRRVYQRMCRIPAGRPMTYGELAFAVGHPRAARAVGGVCGSNPVPIRVPCHRVIAANGLGGFGAGLSWKKRLLEIERELAASARPEHGKQRF